MTWSGRRAAVVGGVVYVVLTALMGHRVLAGIGSTIASDPGDPLLTAAILTWSAEQVPLSPAWWDFPSFHPVPDTIAFTEHLLGVSVLATPIHWLTGNALVTYNATFLLTFPLSALAMFALAYRLTRNAAAAFLAGLAFGFAPFRISHLPHIHILALFWAPLVLLGLHAWLETRRWPWLALAGAAWALQSAANGYMLVFLLWLVAAWVVWFLVFDRRWTDVAAVAGAMLVAALPLLPVLYRYVTVHAEHGFSRSFGEISTFGADMAGVLCAPSWLAAWDWLRVGCRPEGELFAGAGLVALCVAAAVGIRERASPAPVVTGRRGVRVAQRTLLALAAVFALAIASILVLGPWEIVVGPLRASASSLTKPVTAVLLLLLLAGLLTPRLWAAARRHPRAAFYAGIAAAAWVLTWGPTPRLLGQDLTFMPPYLWLMRLPAMDGLRVPARFWMIVMLCLAVLLALLLARWLEGRSGATTRRVVVIGGLLLALDGWSLFPAAAVPGPVPDEAALHGRVVLELPLGDPFEDIAAQYRAVQGGWITVNGYSGYWPAHYSLLQAALAARDDVLFAPFLATDDLFVLVPASDDSLQAFVERQPGATIVARDMARVQYRVPKQGRFELSIPRGERLPIHALTGSCAAAWLFYTVDGNPDTAWHCESPADHEVTLDLGDVRTAGAVVHELGPFSMRYPRALAIDTSLDGVSWEEAWAENVLPRALAAALTDGRTVRLVFPIPPRPARYIRLRQLGHEEGVPWSIQALEVWSGATS